MYQFRKIDLDKKGDFFQRRDWKKDLDGGWESLQR